MAKKSKKSRKQGGNQPANSQGKGAAAERTPPPTVQAEATAVASFERKAARKEGRKDKPARRKDPNWVLLGLAVLGMALTGYLTASHWFGTQLAYCGQGSTCDTVQSSRWATFLKLPVSAWGFLAYAALAWISVRIKDVSKHWQAAWLVALPSLGISLYLTSISLWVIQATCFYCLTSLGLIAAVLVLLAVQSRDVPGISWPGWLGASGGLAIAIVFLMHLHYSGVFSSDAGPEDPYLRGLAERLKQTGAIMYGAYWCPHCQEQKEMFGAAAARLPYVECSPNGPNAPAAPACVAAGVQSFPTWVFVNDRHSGTLPIDELAQRAGYPPRPKGQ